MAESHAQQIAVLLVIEHGLAVVVKSLLVIAAGTVDRAQIGIVDGLARGAAQLVLALERLAEHAVGVVVAVDREVDVAQSVERLHAVLAHLVGSVGRLVAEGERLVVVALRHVENAHAAVVGGTVVERLYPLAAVAHGAGHVESAYVESESLVVAAGVALLLALLAQRGKAVAYTLGLALARAAVLAASQDNGERRGP